MHMRETRAPLPLIFAIAVTRGLLGVGIGLLLSERIRRKHRREVGGVLLGIGALSTVPLAIGLFRRSRARGSVAPFAQDDFMTGETTAANVPQSGIDSTEGLRAD